MSTLAHNMDEITLGFTEDDYKSDRPEPKLDTYFEWRIADAEIKKAKSGQYLTITLKAEALDAQEAVMFPKWINLAVPVGIPSESIMCPDYSKKIFLNTLRPLFPEIAPYDKVEVDAGNGKKVYYKEGEPLAGKAFDIAAEEANKKLGALARDFAREWVENGDKSSLDVFLDRRFFGILKASKDGQYTNIAKINSQPPTDAEVVYSRSEAFKTK